MLTVTSPLDLIGKGSFTIAVGTFDALHRGHQAVFSAAIAAAKATGATPAVLFFSPSPKEILSPEHSPQQILSPGYRMELLEHYGIQTVIAMPFSLELARLTPEQFLHQYLLPETGLHFTAICVGDNWRFGCKNAGDATLLRSLVRGTGVDACIVPPVKTDDGLLISSTRIRELISTGDLRQTSTLLGRPYALRGTVTSGKRIATEHLECPTANLEAEDLLLPPYGVYAARTKIAQSKQCLTGIVYIGDAPTIRGKGNGHPIIELHLFDFHGDLYGQNITVEPLQFLRPSRLFSSISELKQQIAMDVRQTQQLLRTIP